MVVCTQRRPFDPMLKKVGAHDCAKRTAQIDAVLRVLVSREVARRAIVGQFVDARSVGTMSQSEVPCSSDIRFRMRRSLPIPLVREGAD